MATKSRVPPGGPNTPTRSNTRSGTPRPSGEKTIRPQHVLPERKATLRPSATAAWRFRNISMLQYSSWPTDRKPFARRNPRGSPCVSWFET